MLYMVDKVNDSVGRSPRHVVRIMIHTFKDTNHIVWFTFLGLGFCSLLPWNLLLNTGPYFDSKVAVEFNLTSNETSSFTQSMTLATMAPLMIVTCLAPILYTISPVKKMGIGLIGIFVMTVVLLAIMQMTDYFYTTAFTAIVITASFFALLQSSLLAVASNFPMKYMAPVTTGQALCGIVGALGKEYINYKFPSVEEGTTLYLCVGLFITGIGVYAYWRLFYNEFFTFYADVIAPEKRPSELLKSANCTPKTWIYFITMWAVFTQTITVMPAILFDVEMNGVKIVQYILLCFNISDFIGRSLVSVAPGIGKMPWALVGLVLVRLCATVSFFFCAIAHKLYIPTYIGTIPFFIILTFFGLSGGYIAALCFTWGPVGNNSINLSFVGYSMTFALAFGLITGSILTVIVRMYI